MKFNAQAAFFGVELKRAFRGRLELVERIAHECGAVARADMNRVFDLHPRKRLMSAIAEHAFGGAEDAFEPVRGVGESVLNRAPAELPIAVVTLLVTGTEPMERLARSEGSLADRAQLA